MLGLKFLFSRKFGSLHHNSESRPGYWKELFTRPASAFDVSALGWLERGSPLEAGSHISCSSCRSSRRCRHRGWWRTPPGPELHRIEDDQAGIWQIVHIPEIFLSIKIFFVPCRIILLFIIVWFRCSFNEFSWLVLSLTFQLRKC